MMESMRWCSAARIIRCWRTPSLAFLAGKPNSSIQHATARTRLSNFRIDNLFAHRAIAKVACKLRSPTRLTIFYAWRARRYNWSSAKCNCAKCCTARPSRRANHVPGAIPGSRALAVEFWGDRGAASALNNGEECLDTRQFHVEFALEDA